MNIKNNLRKITELSIGLTAVALLALAGCGSGGGDGGAAASVVVSTFAGTSGSPGYSNGTGTNARFVAPAYIASDGTYLYVTDFAANNIRKIAISTGEVTTLAGSTTGISGTADASAGLGTDARFNRPKGITTDGINLYIADTDSHTIRKIVILTGEVTTLAGTAGVSGVANATGASASFRYPWGISRIGTNLYVADSLNSTIRKIDISSASAVVTTLAGTSGNFGYHDSLTGASAVLNYPAGLTTDGAIFVYVTELLNNDVRKINASTGETTTVAGGNYSSPASGVGSADGTGTSARFYSPYGITTDSSNLYVADTINHTIRKIVISTGVVTTLAGTAGVSGVTDATGSAARFNYPFDVIYVNGVLYVADFTNSSIRKIQF